jgi:hypothetical protein
MKITQFWLAKSSAIIFEIAHHAFTTVRLTKQEQSLETRLENQRGSK